MPNLSTPTPISRRCRLATAAALLFALSAPAQTPKTPTHPAAHAIHPKPTHPASQPLPQLVDITASTGIHFQHASSPDAQYILDSMSGGVAILDYDNDGWPDIFFTNAPTVAMAQSGIQARSALYHNNHDGTFTDVTAKAGLAYPCWAMGAAVGDIDNDGWPDLAISCFGGVVLFRNNHDGTFTNITKSSGLSVDQGWATGLAFGDYDNDGFVDLFVPHYVHLDLHNLPTFGKDTCTYHGTPVQCGPRGLQGSPDALYHNNHNGTFTDVSHAAGVDDPNHYFGLQAVWSDLANNGKLDLLVANDSEPNYLYQNLGNGHFKEIALNAGVAVSGDGNEQANMGIALGDYNRSGRQSIAITHFSEDYAALFRNDGDLNFTDVSLTSHIAQPTFPYVGWGDAFLDTTNRGLLDLILVNGHVYPQVDQAHLGVTYREPKLLFWNNGDGTFRNVTPQVGSALSLPQVSRGLAVADLFNTGRLNIVVENLTGSPMILEARPSTSDPRTPPNHWVSFQLQGTTSNRLALNARVSIRTGALQQMNEVLSGGSYLSQSDLRLHFGLGASATIDQVIVHWPDGRLQNLRNLPADRFYTLQEGANPIPDSRITPPSTTAARR